MKKYLGLMLTVWVLIFSVASFSCDKLPWAKSPLKDADAQFLAGNYEAAISLYQAYLATGPSPDKVALAKNKISECYYNLGEKAFKAGNWQDAINYYQQSENSNAQNKISQAYFNLGEDAFNKGDYQVAIEYYSKSKEPGAQAKIQAAQDAIAAAEAEETKKEEETGGTKTVYVVSQPSSKGSGKETKKSEGEFLIKVATADNLKEAQEKVNAVRQLGIPAYNKKSPGKPNVVFAGPFKTRADAQVALARIHSLGKGYKRAHIVEKGE